MALVNNASDFNIAENAFNNISLLPNANSSIQPDIPEEDNIYETIANFLDVYVITLITLGGFVCNIIALMVLNKHGVANSSMCVYLSTLACSDSAVLLLNWINNWPRSALDINLVAYSDVTCRFYRYIFSVSYIYSAWVVVALAAERFLAINFPFLAKTITSVKKAILCVLLILLIDLLVMAYQLFVYEVSNGFCDWHPDFVEFHLKINGWVVGVLYSYVPFFILMGCSLGIIFALVKASRRRSAMTSEKAEDNAIQRVAVTVVTVCLSYLALTTPLALFYLILYNLGMWVEPSPSMTLGESIINIIGLFNHSINLFLYVLTSRSFREDLRRLCRCSTATDVTSSKYLDQSMSTKKSSASLSAAE